VSEETICACIVGLIDKYSMKSKSHKTKMASFMQFLLNPNVGKNLGN
jgi:hypothetical protein